MNNEQHMDDVKILIVGAGAIGACLAAWLAEQGMTVFVRDKPDCMDAIESEGITTHCVGSTSQRRHKARVQVMRSNERVPRVDMVIFAVKNYDLQSAAQEIQALFVVHQGYEPLVVSMANGVENQLVLPSLFKRVIYCVVGFNALRVSPIEMAYGSKGPLLIGAPNSDMREDMWLAQSILSKACPTEVVDCLQDVVHTKLVFNLVNALDALIARGAAPIRNFNAYVELFVNVLAEGAKIVQAAGYHEHRIRGIPSFAVMRIAASLPPWLIRPILRRKLQAVPMLSMVQDVTRGRANSTELESITGYVISMARRVGIQAPYNQAIYELGVKYFYPGFRFLQCEDILIEVKRLRGETTSLR